MKNFICALLSISFLAACGSSPKGETPMAAGRQPNSFQLRPYEVETFKNGLKVLWIPDRTLPYVTLKMMFRSGSSQDPVGKEGLAEFTAMLMDRGTSKRSATQISDGLEQLGTSFQISVSPDYTVAGISSLSFYKNEILKQYQELLMTSNFPQVEIERMRKNRLAGIQKLGDRPDQFAEFVTPEFLFGKHPYGHEPTGTFRALSSFSKADIQAFYAQNFVPANATLAVIGQFDDTYKRELVDSFSKWTAKPAKLSPVPAFPEWTGTEALLVDREDLVQANIKIMLKGIPRNIPDYMEVRAANSILGGSGFGSRLMEELRQKRGLTYGVYSAVDPRDQAGPFTMEGATRVDKVAEFVNEAVKIYKEFVASGVTDAEVENTKQLLKGQFPRAIETPELLAQQLLVLDRYGVSDSYLRDNFQLIDNLNKSSINAVIRKYMDPQNLRIFVYAPRSKTEASLQKIGKLQVKSYKEFLQ